MAILSLIASCYATVLTIRILRHLGEQRQSNLPGDQSFRQVLALILLSAI
jgi:hypothetical protein